MTLLAPLFLMPPTIADYREHHQTILSEKEINLNAYILLGSIALGAQRPIVVKLSRIRSVGR